MESKLKAQAMDSVGERTEFTPSIINKRFPDSFIPENAKVTAVKIGDKVATCVEELPAGYLHLPTKPIEISVKYEPEPKSDAWNEVGTNPDHPCLCETRTEGGSEGWYQFWNGEFFCTESMAQATAIEWGNRNRKSCTKEVQWREVQP